MNAWLSEWLSEALYYALVIVLFFAGVMFIVWCCCRLYVAARRKGFRLVGGTALIIATPLAGMALGGGGLVSAFMGRGVSAQEIEELRRVQAGRDYNVPPRLGLRRPQNSAAEIERLRQQLLSWWRW